MKRYTISFDDRAAEILEKIPKQIRGMILSRLVREAARLGRLDLVMVEEGEDLAEDENKNRARKRRARRSVERKTEKASPEAGISREAGDGHRGTVVRGNEVSGEEVGTVREDEAVSGEGSEKETTSDWIRKFKKEIADRVQI